MPKLTHTNDAYGHEIYDYLSGNFNAYEIVERDDGYIDISSGPSSYFAEYKNWISNEKKAIKLAKGKVLDIGCGAGRVMKYLDGNGFEVVGLDYSPLAIKTCRERGFSALVNSSITAINKQMGIFETFVMFGNNFGLFASFNRARWLLRKMYAMSSTGARIIATTCDPYGTSLPEHLAYHKLNRKRGRMCGQLRLRIRYHKYQSPWFDYLLVSVKEMEKILKGTGWQISEIFDKNTPLYSVVLTKKD